MRRRLEACFEFGQGRPISNVEMMLSESHLLHYCCTHVGSHASMTILAPHVLDSIQPRLVGHRCCGPCKMGCMCFAVQLSSTSPPFRVRMPDVLRLGPACSRVLEDCPAQFPHLKSAPAGYAHELDPPVSHLLFYAAQRFSLSCSCCSPSWQQQRLSRA
jgi:hypothetical protein